MITFPIAMSLIASDVSAMAFIGVPADIYLHGASYWLTLIAVAITGFISYHVYLPVLYKLQLMSCFEYLKIRFDEKNCMFASFLLCFSTILHLPITIYIPALAFSQAPIGEEGGFLPIPSSFTTRSIHAGYTPGQYGCKSVIPSISISTTYAVPETGERVEFEYNRWGNPSRTILERTLASLENAKHAATYPSGIAAVTAVLTLLKSGDHFITCDDVYGGTSRTFREIATNFGITPSFVDTLDLKQVEAAIQPNTKMIWIEVPTNPTLQVYDVGALAEISKKHNLMLAVDNSFLTPYLHRPLEFGAHVVMYSLTKYMNGHSDVMMGAVVTNSSELYQKLKLAQDIAGIIPSPYDCSQLSRSLKTLALRMKQHHSNGYEVAKFLMSHPIIAKVLHPGFTSHPQHELYKKQCSGYSGIVSFYHKKGFEESKKFLKALKMFRIAGSLGGMSSTVELPLTLSHAAVPPEQLKKLNITDNLVRLSLGIEEPEDIIADQSQVLDQI